VATDVATSAALPAAESIGDVGDPAYAIIQAAHEHQVDVIVVGSHTHSWFSRLFTGSVSNDLLREADIPVLVVK
jgi:nucleotide-binding universal stress UspA family protein